MVVVAVGAVVVNEVGKAVVIEAGYCAVVDFDEEEKGTVDEKR